MRFASKKILQTHASEKWWNKFYFISLQSSLHCDRSYFKSYIHPIHFFLSLAWGCSQPLKLHFQNFGTPQPNTLSPSAKRGEKGKESGGNQFLSFRPFIRLTPVSHASVRQTLRQSRSILSYDSSKGLASNTSIMQRLFQRRKSCCNHQMLRITKRDFEDLNCFSPFYWAQIADLLLFADSESLLCLSAVNWSETGD